MALDQTPGEIVVKTRDEVLADGQRDYRLRQPGADTSFGGQPYVDCAVLADAAMPLYNNAQVAGRASTAQTATGQALRNICEPVIGPPNGPTQSFGSARIIASSGGVPIAQGSLLVDDKTSLSYQFVGSTGTYSNGDQISIGSVSTGPSVNVAAGTKLRWVSPPAGLGALATVVAQADGTGLSGGRPAESDDDYRARYFDRQANPPAGGNDSDILNVVSQTPNLSVLCAFTFPAYDGGGTTGVAFLLQPAGPGATRSPNPTQMAIVQQRLDASFRGDDYYAVTTCVPQPFSLVLKATWKFSAVGFSDATPWPSYNATDKVKVDNAVPITATSFRLTTTQNQPTSPQPGQTVAFLDLTLDASGIPKAKFRAKRILTATPVVANKSWDIVCDTTNGASDTGYTPVNGQYASPWSASLNDVAVPVLNHVDAFGVGEIVAVFPDPGRRQRRFPFNPDSRPSSLTNRLVDEVQAVASVSSAQIAEPALPLAPPIGTGGVIVYYLSVGDVAVFPQ